MAESINAVYIKAGGSLITFKDKPFTLNRKGLESLAEIITRSLQFVDGIVLGNGGGSFAHPVVEEYSSGDPRDLIVHCQRATRLLNKIVVDYMVDHGVRSISIQTSAIIYEESGGLRVHGEPLIHALRLGLVPTVYGECVFSDRGVYRVLSTESVFDLLSRYVRPRRLVLLVNVDGVYTCDPEGCSSARLIRRIDNGNIEDVLSSIGGSAGIDVTGGIRHKVESMYSFSRRNHVPVYIVSGFRVEDAVRAIRGEEPERGTVIIGY